MRTKTSITMDEEIRGRLYMIARGQSISLSRLIEIISKEYIRQHNISKDYDNLRDKMRKGYEKTKERLRNE